MKKWYISIFFMYPMICMANDTDMLELRFGLNTPGHYNEVHSPEFKNDSTPQGIGYGFNAELVHEPLPNVVTGIGVGYQKNSKVRIDQKNYNIIDTIPIYLVTKYKFNKNGVYHPYLKVNLGASIPYTSKDLERTGVKSHTGYYYALGGGIEYQDFLMDLSYQWNYNKLTGKYRATVIFSRLTFSVGYKIHI